MPEKRLQRTRESYAPHRHSWWYRQVFDDYRCKTCLLIVDPRKIPGFTEAQLPTGEADAGTVS